MNKELDGLKEAARVLRVSISDSGRIEHALRKQLQIELLLYIATQLTIIAER